MRAGQCRSRRKPGPVGGAGRRRPRGHHQGGRADYVLYVDRKLVGVIEAKREGADLTAAEQQADGYAAGSHASQRRWPGGRASVPLRPDGGGT